MRCYHHKKSLTFQHFFQCHTPNNEVNLSRWILFTKKPLSKLEEKGFDDELSALIMRCTLIQPSCAFRAPTSKHPPRTNQNNEHQQQSCAAESAVPVCEQKQP